MKQNAKILEFKGKKLETIEDVRAVLIAILEDIQSGDATVTEVKPITEEIKKLMRILRAELKRANSEDKAALKSFFDK